MLAHFRQLPPASFGNALIASRLPLAAAVASPSIAAVILQKPAPFTPRTPSTKIQQFNYTSTSAHNRSIIAHSFPFEAWRARSANWLNNHHLRNCAKIVRSRPASGFRKQPTSTILRASDETYESARLLRLALGTCQLRIHSLLAQICTLALTTLPSETELTSHATTSMLCLVQLSAFS